MFDIQIISLLLPGAAIGLVIIIRRTEAMMQAVYNGTMFTPLVAAFLTGLLLLPTAFYVAFYDRCGGPDRIVPWLMAVCIAVPATVLAWDNAKRLRRLDIVVVTTVQTLVLVVVMIVAAGPVTIYEGLNSHPYSARHRWCD